MGIFDNLFGKKEEESYYDSTNIRVNDLDVGFVFEYDLSTWKVDALYEYDWGDNYFTRECKITDGERTLFLGMEEDDELILTMGQKISLAKLGAKAVDKLMNDQKPPKTIDFEGETFIRTEKAPGYFHDTAKDDFAWEEFICWDYENEAGTKQLSIEQWGDQEFEASVASYIKEYQISNILPGKDRPKKKSTELNKTNSNSMKGIAKGVLAIILVFMVLKSCINCTRSNSGNTATRTEVAEMSPLNLLVKKLKDEKNFSIILYDMDTKNPDSSNPEYYHQYQVVTEQPDTVIAKVTEWHQVSPTLFNKHINDLGMEIISKKDGILHQQASPAGYTNYVGNERYGHWVQRDGGSFWEFYGKYAFMSSMFHMLTYPARRAYWDDYHGNYYRSGRSYYGPTGRTVYGTTSYANTSSGKKSTWSSKPTSFKSKVRSQVSRSSSSPSSRSYNSSSSYGSGNKTKTSRSSSRSSSGSSYRSRGGGFGK